MKILGFEDMIVGILLGIIMIGASDRFFTLPYNNLLLKIFLFLFLFLAVLDIIHEIKTITEGPLFTLSAVIWNIVEILFALHHLSSIFEWSFPVITVVPLVGVVGLFGAGVFFILGNVMWLYLYFNH